MECLGKHKVRWCHLSHFTSLRAPGMSPGLLYPPGITLGLKAGLALPGHLLVLLVGSDSEGLSSKSRLAKFRGREL